MLGLGGLTLTGGNLVAGSSPPVGTNVLLLEDGNDMLLENGNELLLET